VTSARRAPDNADFVIRAKRMDETDTFLRKAIGFMIVQGKTLELMLTY
jgi:hypothetical protein